MLSLDAFSIFLLRFLFTSCVVVYSTCMHTHTHLNTHYNTKYLYELSPAICAISRVRFDFIEKHQHLKATTMKHHWHVFTLLQHVRFTWHLHRIKCVPAAHIPHISWPKTTKIESHKRTTRRVTLAKMNWQKWCDGKQREKEKLGHWKCWREIINKCFSQFCRLFLVDFVSTPHHHRTHCFADDVILNLFKLLSLSKSASR